MFFGRDLYRIRVKITTETLPRCRRKTTANPCTSYLGHPFKNMLLAKGKILPPCLQTKVGEDKIGSRQHARTTTISCKGVAYFVGRVLTYLLQLRGFCLDVLPSRFLQWTKPLSASLLLETLADLGRSRSQLIAENALLRQQLIILRRQVKRPSCSKADRTLLVLLARLVRTWEQALVIVQPDTLLRWHRELSRQLWKRTSKAASHTPKIAAETIALIKAMAAMNRRLRC